MGISFSSGNIYVTDGTYNFEDIYQASQDHNNTYCKKMGNSYLITNDLHVGNDSDNTVLEAENISVTINGDLFQIHQKAELRFGKKDSNGATYNGVYVSCPNIRNGYGFGCKTLSNGLTKSGDIYLYDSFLNIYGFWGFFGGTSQICEVVDCLVNGYGRLEGNNTIIENITTQASHGRYGCIAPKGIVQSYKNIVTKKVNEYSGHTCSVYFNPKYSPNMIVKGGVFDGYSEGLVYAEKNSTGVTEAGYITFVDSEIKNGYGAYYSDNNTKIFINYTFSPVFKNSDDNLLGNVDVEIKNNLGDVVHQGTSDQYGRLSVELLKHWEDKNGSETYSYYDITATSGSTSVTRRYDAGVTYIDCPFYVTNEGSGSGGSGDCCLEDIQSKLDALQTALENKIETKTAEIKDEVNANETKIDNLSDNTNQMLIALGEEIDENQSIIESKTGNTRMFL